MTAPVQYKTIKVSVETHRQIHDLAAHLGSSADEALAQLLSDSTVRVPLSAVQHDRWKAAAQATGVTLAEFIQLRVEAALHDPATLELIYQGVYALCRTAGLRAPHPTSRAPGAPDRATPGAPESTSPDTTGRPPQ